jgi:peptidoglycan/xylan/chitin deacetylase (PgdA/CDA1 family)
MTLRRNKSIVPALMFHSVGLERHPWAWSSISESIESFEGKIAMLKQKGFTGVFWDELYEHMAGRTVLPADSILLTFDDGYLDNWTTVFPILQKYGMKATIFVSPDFVDPSNELRSSHAAGFLNWAEMREMEKSGLIDIQSHAMTHTWYFAGPRIDDYHRPHEVTPNPWLFWNARPDRKPFYLTEDQQEFLPWGYPVLQHAKSLAVRRFFPDEASLHAITSFAAAEGGHEFFGRQDWRAVLDNHVASIVGDDGIAGFYESETERTSRIREELQRSKEIIEANLNKQVDFICWPGGANDELVQQLAREVGYKSWTLSSSSALEKRNLPGTDPETIKRIGTTNVINIRGKHCGFAGPGMQLLKIFSHQGSSLYSMALKAQKLAALATRPGVKA